MKIFHARDLLELNPNSIKILRHEPVVVRALEETGLLEQIIPVLDSFVSRTTQLVIEIDHASFENPILQKLLVKGARVAVHLAMAADPNSDFLGIIKHYGGDRRYLDTIHLLRVHWGVGAEQIIPCFDIERDQLLLLGSTIQQLRALGHKVFFFDHNGPPRDDVVQQVHQTFEFLEMVGANDIFIYFSFFSSFANAWILRTRCTYSGICDVHLDISNKCSHSCHFCGLYSNDAFNEVKRASKSESLPPDLKKLMSMQIDKERALSIIAQLPWTVQRIQFGGIGDPLMHTHAIELIEASRERGFEVEVLTNLEYLDANSIARLHALGGANQYGIKLIVNISGATAESYVRTRPRQSASVFHRVIGNLKMLTELRNAAAGFGIYFTLMCVITRLNFRDVIKFVHLAKELGAHDAWFKPLERHSQWMKDYQLDGEDLAEYRTLLREALSLADEIGVSIAERYMLNSVIQEGEHELAKQSGTESRIESGVAVADYI